MKWWPSRRRGGEPSEEARQVLRQTQRLLADVEQRDQVAEDVAERLRDIRRRNHFGAALDDLFRRRA